MSKDDLEATGGGAGHYLVDFDRTLVRYDGWDIHGEGFGTPVPAMVERVVRWLKSGIEVRLFTARASRYKPDEMAVLRAWCVQHLGQELKIQNYKDFDTIAIWDDLATGVQPNTGFRESTYCEGDPLSAAEEEELVDIALKQLES
jgi:hypothetical protein